ncbi:MAG: LacI family transcriptional regulator [Calditrichaeota bacterium]|nr:MAG: LacI family transcriptional regulator [Calditrichota bacterium]
MQIRQIDIAKQLNVTRMTVSKALRDHSDISHEMKEKVRGVAKELGYIPNRMASQLQNKKSHTIGVVIPDISNSFFSYTVHGIMDAAEHHGYDIIMAGSRESERVEKNNIFKLLSLQVDGILVAVSTHTTDREIFEIVKRTKTPLVFFDRSIKDAGFSCVGIDNVQAAFKLVSFVIQQGYTKIAHLGGYSDFSVAKMRCEGYRKALAENNIPVNNDWIIKEMFDRNSGYKGFKKLFSLENKPEVIFAANDIIAQGTYDAAREAGIRIPEDLGIVAFGHHEFATFLYPTLTVIDGSPKAVGQKALNLLVEEIGTSGKTIAQNVHLQAEIEINQSLRLKSQ